MRIVQINSTCGNGSTGKICVAVSELLSAEGIENYIFYSSGKSAYPLGRRYMSTAEIKCQALISRVLGTYGFQAKSATRRLLRELDRISPDIIHLHNLHSHDIHLGMLFSYLKEKRIKIFWTFHDCWAFTGYCPHYDMIGCDQWKNGGCNNCPQRKRFSWFFDRSRYLFEKKKALFSGLDMTIVTPSQWLADQVKQSFLSGYEVKVINNGIDLLVFRPVESDFRERYNIENKYIVLGVAFGWGERKGLDVFIRLAEHLDPTMFQIVLVGTNQEIDKMLPVSIVSIHRTQNQTELAEIYSAADVFVNPTREEALGLTNIEALACGTPVITFKSGGSPECIDENCGIAVDRNDYDAMEDAIKMICLDGVFLKDACVEKACTFDQNDKFNEYIKLYM